MRQSGTLILALAVAWLLVLAEGRGQERAESVPRATTSEVAQVAPTAVVLPRGPVPRRWSPGGVPRRAEAAGELAARACRQGVQLLI